MLVRLATRSGREVVGMCYGEGRRGDEKIEMSEAQMKTESRGAGEQGSRIVEEVGEGRGWRRTEDGRRILDGRTWH